MSKTQIARWAGILSLHDLLLQRLGCLTLPNRTLAQYTLLFYRSFIQMPLWYRGGLLKGCVLWWNLKRWKELRLPRWAETPAPPGKLIWCFNYSEGTTLQLRETQWTPHTTLHSSTSPHVLHVNTPSLLTLCLWFIHFILILWENRLVIVISIVSVIANCLLLYTFELTKRSSTDNQLERGLTDRLCHSIRHNNGQLYYAVWKKKRMSCRGCVGVIISMYVCMYTSVYIGSPACASVSLCVRACVCQCVLSSFITPEGLRGAWAEW